MNRLGAAAATRATDAAAVTATAVIASVRGSPRLLPKTRVQRSTTATKGRKGGGRTAAAGAGRFADCKESGQWVVWNRREGRRQP